MEANVKTVDAFTESSSAENQSAQTEKNTLGFFSLPAELRNKIYELIFEHKDPIFVAQHEHPANIHLVTYRRITDQNDGLAHPRGLRMQTVPGTPCVRVYQPGIPLFLASRKTYEEASSVF